MIIEGSEVPEQLSSAQTSLPLRTALKNAREKLGLSQDALALRVGYERTAIARIETGRNLRPSLQFLEKCEKVLDLVPGTLQQLVSTDEARKRPLTRGDERVPEYSRVYRSFPYELVDDLFAAARKRISILQTYIPDIQPFMSGIQQALLNGAKLEILVLDPRCDAAALRLQGLRIPRKNYLVLQLAKLMIDLDRLQIVANGTWEVRIHSFPHSIHMYATEDSAILGFYWNIGFSLQGPQIEVSAHNSTIGEQAWSEFDHLWSSARNVSATDVDLGEPSFADPVPGPS